MPKLTCKNLERPSEPNSVLQNQFNSGQQNSRLKKRWRGLKYPLEIEAFQKSECNQLLREWCRKALDMKSFQGNQGHPHISIMAPSLPQFWNQTSPRDRDQRQRVGQAQFIIQIEILKVLLKVSVSAHIKLVTSPCFQLVKFPNNSMSNSKILVASRKSKVICLPIFTKEWVSLLKEETMQCHPSEIQALNEANNY